MSKMPRWVNVEKTYFENNQLTITFTINRIYLWRMKIRIWFGVLFIRAAAKILRANFEYREIDQ